MEKHKHNILAGGIIGVIISLLIYLLFFIKGTLQSDIGFTYYMFQELAPYINITFILVILSFPVISFFIGLAFNYVLLSIKKEGKISVVSITKIGILTSSSLVIFNSYVIRLFFGSPIRLLPVSGGVESLIWMITGTVISLILGVPLRKVTFSKKQK